MKKYFITTVLQMILLVSFAQNKSTEDLSEGAALLFKDTKSNLNNNEKNRLFSDMGFTLSKDKKQFMFEEPF